MMTMGDMLYVGNSFRTLNISCQPFLATQVAGERSAVNLLLLLIKFRDPLYLVALRIFSIFGIWKFHDEISGC